MYPLRPDLSNRKFFRCVKCDASVGCHPVTGLALGTLANLELRVARKQAHNSFDPLWKHGNMTRTRAYEWLSEKLGIPTEKCHIGQFGMEECNRTISECDKEYEKSHPDTPF